MSRPYAIALLLLTAASSAFGKSTGPVHLAKPQSDSLLAAYAKDRADTEHDLRDSPTSYLAAIARTDFGDKSALILGSAPGCDLRVNDPEVASHHLRVTVAGDSFRVEAVVDTAHFVSHGVSMRSAVLPPGFIQVGRFMVRLSHQRFPALIAFDPKSARFADYHGLSWYPPDLTYRFVLPLTPDPKPDTSIIMSTRGNARRAVLAGWFDLNVKGKPVRLEAHRLLEPGVDEESVSVFFRDATTGTDTYAVGRYIDPERLPNGDWVVDFNNAYNPACATSPYYNCPIPSKANHLKVAIPAGEKDSHYSH